MKLKTFNSTNVVVQRTSIPFVHMNAKTGLACFNKEFCDKTGLKPGDMVQLLQDEEDESTWYLEKVKKDGFLLRNNENLSRGCFWNNTTIVRMIFSSVVFEKQSGRLPLGEEVTFEKRKLYTLITAGLRN